MNEYNIQVSLFEWNYWHKSTFWWYSNYMTSTCIPCILDLMSIAVDSRLFVNWILPYPTCSVVAPMTFGLKDSGRTSYVRTQWGAVLTKARFQTVHRGLSRAAGMDGKPQEASLSLNGRFSWDSDNVLTGLWGNNGILKLRDTAEAYFFATRLLTVCSKSLMREKTPQGMDALWFVILRLLVTTAAAVVVTGEVRGWFWPC